MSNFNSKPVSESAIGINSDNAISGGNWTGNNYLGQAELNDFSYMGFNLQTDEDGSLTYEFSQDAVNWSAYPFMQFTITSGINEVHGAWKGGRYVRAKFTGTGGRTFFRLKTFYSYQPVILTAPLNQPISGDSDATIVKAILNGADENDPSKYIQQQFTEDGAAKVSDDSSIINFRYDAFVKVNASTTTDRYDYFQGGVNGTKVAEVLTTYGTTAKNDVVKVERTNL